MTKVSKVPVSKYNMEKFPEKIIKSVIKNVDVQKGILILDFNGILSIQAHIDINGNVNIIPSISVEEYIDNPLSLIEYIIMAEEHIILDAAVIEKFLTEDSYIIRNKPKSIIYLPLKYKQQSKGILYLENNIRPAEFTQDQCNLLQMLGSYIAISIENAYLSVLQQKDCHIVDEKTEILNKYKAVLKQVKIRLKKAEEALKASEHTNSTLVEKVSDGTVIIQDGLLKFVNPGISDISGYRAGDMISQSFIAPAYREFMGCSCKKPLTSHEGNNRFEKKPADMAIISDMTKHKMPDDHMKKRLMKFRLEEGFLYLVKEQMLSREVFRDLLNTGYEGLVLSMSPREESGIGRNEGAYEYIWLTKREDQARLMELQDIRHLIEKKNKRQAILIDGLDHLIFQNGFKEIRGFIYSLKEITFLGSHVIIIFIDPSMVSDGELTILENETKKVLLCHRESVPEDQLDILKYIYRKNLSGIQPNYTKIGEGLKLTRPTVRKKIKLLIQAGYLQEVVKGRAKFVEITEKGRTIRNIAYYYSESGF